MTEEEVTQRLKALQRQFWMDDPGRGLKEFFDYVIQQVPANDWPEMLAAMAPENKKRWEDRIYRYKIEHASDDELVDISKQQGTWEDRIVVDTGDDDDKN